MFKKYEELIKNIKLEGSVPSNLPDNIAMEVNINTRTEGDFSFKVQFTKTRTTVDLSFIPQNGKIIESYSANSSDLNKIQSILNPTMSSAIFDSYIDYILSDISNKSKFYYDLLDKCVWEETDDNHPCSTLAVCYDSTLKKFKLYYNPNFIMLGAITQYLYASRDFKSLEDCYIYMLKFYLIHEMSHITRAHVFSDDTDLKNVDPQLVNIYGDSFINQTIPSLVLKETKSTPPILGIVNELIKKGRCNITIKEVVNAFCSFLKTFTGYDSYIPSTIFSHPLGECLVQIKMGNLLTHPEYSKDLNSSLFIKSLNKLFKTILDQEEDLSNGDSQQGEGGQQGNSQQGEGGQQGGQSSQSQRSSNTSGGQGGSQGDSQSSGGQSSGSGEGGSSDSFDDLVDKIKDGKTASNQSKQKSEKELDSNAELSKSVDSNDPEKKKKIKEAIDKAMSRDTKEGLKSALGGDYSSITGEKSSNKNVWKRNLNRVVSNALGIKEVWNSEAPSSRIQGQLGREVEVPDIKKILIMLDCSGSMSPETFRKLLVELPNLSSLVKSKPTVYVVYWGSSQYYKKYKLDANLFKRIKSDAKGLGGTDYDDAFEYATSIVKNPDFIIECTDTQFYNLRQTTLRNRKKWNKKTLWVLARDYDKKVLSKIDPQSGKRKVVL